DLGGRLFTELMSVAISLSREDARYAVVRAATVFVRNVPFVDGNFSVLPVEGATNVFSARTATKLVGWADPQRAFSKYTMVFDRALVLRMIQDVSARVPNKRFDEAILDCLDLDNPGFSLNDTYGWYCMRAAAN